MHIHTPAHAHARAHTHARCVFGGSPDFGASASVPPARGVWRGTYGPYIVDY